MRALVRTWRAAGEGVALVPTMGDLHAGHLALVERAREQSRRVVVSIFVNPLQFGAGEDYETYPRTLERDRERLGALGVDAVFAPDVAALYPRGLEQAVRVVVPELEDILCGAERPGHFAGVATVVTRLFNSVEPDLAVFGEKDYQQLLIIQRLIDDLAFGIELCAVSPPCARPMALHCRREIAISLRSSAQSRPSCMPRCAPLPKPLPVASGTSRACPNGDASDSRPPALSPAISKCGEQSISRPRPRAIMPTIFAYWPRPAWAPHA